MDEQILWTHMSAALNQASNGAVPTSAFYGSGPFLRTHNEKVYDNGYQNGMAFAILWQVNQKHKPQSPEELWTALSEEMQMLPTNDVVLRPVYQQMMHEIEVGF
jgi:hypothetical protein